MSYRPAFRAAAVIVLTVLLLPWPTAGDPHGPAIARPTTSGGSPLSGVPVITDDARTSVTTTLGSIGVRDTVTPGELLAGLRSYDITLGVAVRDSAAAVIVESNPVAEWAFPDQLPGGSDNLPPLSDWAWWVQLGGANDTANWTFSPNGTEIERNAPLVNATYTVTGVSRPVDTVTVGTGVRSGVGTPALGVVMANPAPPGPGNRSVPELLSVARSLQPQVIRFGLSSVNAVEGWDTATGAAQFNFTGFDAEMGFIQSVPASALLSLPAGNWGDGNNLPPGMPVNSSFNVSFYGLIGQYPDPVAYGSFVGAIVNHTIEAGENVEYWNIGNEVPVFPTQDAQAYAQAFNAASHAIHRRLPNALVGSDVLNVRAGFPTLSAQLRGVGFLSYHLYSSTSICINAGHYCPPTANGPGLSTPLLLTSGVDLSRRYFYAPHLAQELWFNATGRWLPVLDSESNIDTVAGGVVATSSGTDPRMQNLVAGAWLTAMLISGAAENLSELTYFNLQDSFPVNDSITAAMGGWGFGMTGVTPTRSVVDFAPYWAAWLWTQAFPWGATPRPLTVGDPDVIDAFAARNASGTSVVVANLVDVPVRVSVESSGSGQVARSAEFLDGSTYQQPYNASNGTAYLAASGIGHRSFAAGQSGMALGGYGVALFHLAAPVGSGNGTNGTNGSGGSSGGGNASGGSGNSSGSSSGGSSTNGTGTNASTGGGGTWSSGGSGGASNGSGGSGSTGGSAAGNRTGGYPTPGNRTGRGTSGGTAAVPALQGPEAFGVLATQGWKTGLLLVTGVVVLLGWRAARRPAKKH